MIRIVFLPGEVIPLADVAKIESAFLPEVFSALIKCFFRLLSGWIPQLLVLSVLAAPDAVVAIHNIYPSRFMLSS